jgi:ABC-2 type transport system permease protein
MMRLFPHQLRAEQRLFWRSRELAFFTFLFPLLIFVLLGSVYGDETIKKEHGVKGSAYLLAGILGYGVVSTAFAGLAIVLVVRRESGVLKRLRGTPLSPATYLGAVIASIVIVYLIESVALIVMARLLYDVPLPHEWLSVILAVLFGTLAFAAMGFALTGLIRSDEGASAVVNAIYLPVSFLAGAFWTAQSFPHFLTVISEILPLTHFIRLMRNIVLLNQPIWDNWEQVAVIAAWGLGGLILSVRYFRWEPTGS